MDRERTIRNEFGRKGQDNGWVMNAFNKLARLVNPDDYKNALKGLNIIITHIKPDFSLTVKPREIVIRQLNEHNNLGLNFIFAEQGKKMEL